MKPFRTARRLRNLVLHGLLVVSAVAVVTVFFLRSGSSTKDLPFSDVIAAARVGDVKTIQVDGRTLNVTKKQDPQHYTSRIGSSDLEQTLKDNGVTIGGGDGVDAASGGAR